MHKKSGLTIVVLLILALIAGAAVIIGLALMSKSSPYIEQGITPSGIVKNVVHNDIVETQNFASLQQIPVKYIDELSKSKSAEEMVKVKDFNDTVLNPNTNIDSRKKAVQELMQLEFIETRDRVSVLLDDLTELKKSGSPDKKDDEIIGYITVTLNELYKETNKFAGTKKENQPDPTFNSSSEQASLSENPAPAAVISDDASAEAASAPESTVPETTTQKSLIELANLKMDTAGSVDKLTVVLFDKNQSQAVKLLGLKKLVELDAKTSLPVFEALFAADSSVSNDVVKVTAIKAVYDMNTPEALSLLEETAQLSGNDRVKETIKQLTGK